MGRTKGAKNKSKDEIAKEKEAKVQTKDIKKAPVTGSNVPILTKE
jgi:hypothetical protein